ncbi:major facilitator superfamily MFS_1, partial [mine drainage metagenome]
GTATQLGEVLAAQSVPLVAFLLIGGGLADRWGRRMVMVVADLMRVAAQGSLGCWILLGHPPLWAFASAEAVVGLGTALFAPASTGLVPELVTNPDHLQQANSLRGLATSLATVVGPAAAGVIVAAANPGWAVVADSISYAVSAGSLLMLHLPAAKARSAT